MVDYGALEKLFEKIQALAKIVENKPMPTDKLPPDVMARLEGLEQLVAMLKKLNTDAFNRLGVSEEQVKEAINSVDMLPKKGQRIMQQAKKLKEECDTIQRKFLVASTHAKQKEKKLGKKGTSPSAARKKKFNRIGGRKDWKPL